MFKKLIKKIVKKIASPARLAKYAADGIARGVNAAAADKQAAVVKYATMANRAAQIGETLSKMLADDGAISNLERDDLETLLRPLFAAVMQVV